MPGRTSWHAVPSRPERAGREPLRPYLNDVAFPVNTLITGDAPTRRVALALALGRTPPRIHVRQSTEDLKPEGLNEGVLILHDVDALPLDRQISLLRWMDTVGPRVRVIALAGRPLYDLVLQGRFRTDLYYRLCLVQGPA